MLKLVKQIAAELKLQDYQVHNTTQLLFDDEATIPFVARYRKERTGGLDESRLREIRDRYKYLLELESSKEKYLKVVAEHCQKKPELQGQFEDLKKRFEACKTKQELEDLYLPFKPKRRTRAQLAKEKGLEPLLDKILQQRTTLNDLTAAAQEFVTKSNEDIEPSLRVSSAEEALKGAADIYAERISETADNRALVRRISQQTGEIVATKIEKKTSPSEQESKDAQSKKKRKPDKSHKYENYFNYRERLDRAAAHRVMAIRRGEAEKILRVIIEVDTEQILTELKKRVLGDQVASDAVKSWLETVIEDAYKRLLAPSIETELRLDLKHRAETEAIRVFSKNLESLLLLPPMPEKIVMGIDPGLRTGSKLAVVSKTGKLLAYETIYPQFDKPNSPKNTAAKESLLRLIREHRVEYLAVGNGTGGREINRFIRDCLKDENLTEIKRLFVNESGASVYSTDAIAREEFPELDPTIRSAISIARRLQDPLAELVKIDPRSIGVGQYQHDVNVTRLKSSLEEVVESCVNRVGVNLNTASTSLLGYVAGVGRSLAKSIVNYRDKTGPFGSRADLEKVSGFGRKIFTQAAGFLRVPDAKNPLDNSAVHPESYTIVEKICRDQNMSVSELIGKSEIVAAIPLESYVTDEIGMPTLKDIAAELIKPGRDPRDEGRHVEYSDEVADLEDLKKDMELQGTVTNVTNFGAFVDIGVHQDGLVHISELSNDFVKDPALVVSVGDIVNVRVLDVDLERRRISLSCKPKHAPAPSKKSENGARRSESRFRKNHQPTKSKRGPRSNRSHKNNKQQPNYTVEDLLNKFNRKV